MDIVMGYRRHQRIKSLENERVTRAVKRRRQGDMKSSPCNCTRDRILACGESFSDYFGSESFLLTPGTKRRPREFRDSFQLRDP